MSYHRQNLFIFHAPAKRCGQVICVVVTLLMCLLPATGKTWLLAKPWQDNAREQTSIDPADAAGAFAEAAAMFSADDGQLWGKNLAGPMLFVEPATRAVVANQPDAAGSLAKHATAQGDVYVGIWPEGKPIANTAVEWSGVRWAMVMWPLPEDAFARRALMAHESWHRIQGELGFASSGADNSHLDSLAGRVWLQLEWRALAAALQAESAADQRSAAADALIFRARRRAMIDGAAAAEREMEMHEGLAEYTGLRLADADNDAVRGRAIDVLHDRPATLPTFVRSFAYVSGPPYGLLLDQFAPDWRLSAADADFGEMLAEALGDFELPDDLSAAAESRAAKYNGEALVTAENKREEERLTIQAEFRKKYVDGPVVLISFRQMQMSFNPNAITPFEEHGTVYRTITISDAWGELKADDGCLVGKDWRSATLAAGTEAAAGMIAGPGWTLTLKEGWSVMPDKDRQGSFVLREK